MAVETFNVLYILSYLRLLLDPPWLGAVKFSKQRFAEGWKAQF